MTDEDPGEVEHQGPREPPQGAAQDQEPSAPRPRGKLRRSRMPGERCPASAEARAMRAVGAAYFRFVERPIAVRPDCGVNAIAVCWAQ
jgi:hypothetical protein